jgi:nanoRNase/pAp phosphatase (c-di-AMP/oligoRNAs hydrolase)
MLQENISNQDRLKKLFKIVRRKRKILVLTHNNPDPDSLASALALKYIIRIRCNVDSIIGYGGVVGRAENKAMIKNLKITVRPVTDINMKNFSVVALVDSQPGSGNNSLPKSITPSIIFDHHHPVRAKSRKSPFVDIRTDYGSTSTILTEYLKASNIQGIDRNVATALFYGIKSDTRDLGRGTNPQDLEAFLYLYPRVNFKVLSRIEHPALSREHFKTFEKAIKNAVIYKDVVVSDVDRIDNPDSLAEMADLLVRLEGINWSLCLGTFQDDIYFSVRTTKTRERADRVVQKMVRKIGSAGGHNMVAAGKVDHSFIHRNDHAATMNTLISRFLKGIKREAFQGKNL